MIQSENIITRKVALIISDRAAHKILLEKICDKLTIKCLKASTLYEAEGIFLQELPHLIISDAFFSDGNLQVLHNKLQTNDSYKKTPMIVTLQSNDPSESKAIGQRKYHYVSEGTLDPQLLLQNISAIFKSYHDLSPQFMSLENTSINRQTDIWVKATLLGRYESFLAIDSNVYLDPRSAIRIKPESGEIDGINMVYPSNTPHKNTTINLFPIGEVEDVNKEWLTNTYHLKSHDLGSAEPIYKVAFIQDSANFKQIQIILRGYGIEAQNFKNVQEFVGSSHKERSDISGIYYSNDSDSKDLSLFHKLYQKTKIPILIKTNDTEQNYGEGLYFIKSTFSMASYIEILRSLCIRGSEVMDHFEKTGQIGVPVSYHTVGDLCGLDERGGIIEMSFPLPAGTSLNLKNSFFEEIWDGNFGVEITGFSPMKGNPNRWYMKFEKLLKGFSKGRYWSDVLGKVESIKNR